MDVDCHQVADLTTVSFIVNRHDPIIEDLIRPRHLISWNMLVNIKKADDDHRNTAGLWISHGGGLRGEAWVDEDPVGGE